jgi:hypothetical protein
MPSHMRIELCNRAVQDSNCKDWLKVDQWEWQVDPALVNCSLLIQ